MGRRLERHGNLGWAAKRGMNLQSSTLKNDETGEAFHVQQAAQIRAYRAAWKEAGHKRDPATGPTGFTSSEPVTEAGLKAVEFQLHQAREAYEKAQKIEDVNERRRQAATPLRDVRSFAARVWTAQVITDPASTDTVAFGSTVTFRRDDERV